jgi:hypothetical protein
VNVSHLFSSLIMKCSDIRRRFGRTEFQTASLVFIAGCAGYKEIMMLSSWADFNLCYINAQLQHNGNPAPVPRLHYFPSRMRLSHSALGQWTGGSSKHENHVSRFRAASSHGLLWHQDLTHYLCNYGSQVWKVAANIFNKQSRISDKGWSSSLGVERGATTPHRKK